ncbi:MAG: hypothetical protein WEE89_21730 [Gemmatimonadota bacterium]
MPVVTRNRLARTAVVLLAIGTTGCRKSSFEQDFSVAEWRTAKPRERARMATDFLRTHDVIGMSEAELKQLLGEPTNESDSWTYDLSENGPPPAGPQPSQVFMKHPQLYVFFKQGRVSIASPTYMLELRDDVVFDPRFWAPRTPARLAMVYDLLNRRLLISLDKPQVLRLLGPPDQKTEARTLSYDLGMRMLDGVTLTFTMDSVNRVTRGRILEH